MSAKANVRILICFQLTDEDVEKQINAKKTMKLLGHDQHYKNVYKLHNAEVQDFFTKNSPKSLHVGPLENNYKSVKLDRFLDVDVPENYVSHENLSNCYRFFMCLTNTTKDYFLHTRTTCFYLY